LLNELLGLVEHEREFTIVGYQVALHAGAELSVVAELELGLFALGRLIWHVLSLFAHFDSNVLINFYDLLLFLSLLVVIYALLEAFIFKMLNLSISS
jgi:hypothetical protein